MTIWYNYSKLVAAVLSTIGSMVMVIAAGAGLKLNRGAVNQILFSMALSDFIYSVTSVVTNTIKVIGDDELRNSWWHRVFVMAVHWSFEVSAFMWTATLGLYIMRARRNFQLKYAYLFIGSGTLIYFVAEYFDLVIIRGDSSVLNYAVRITWDVVAILTLRTVIVSMIVFSKQKKVAVFSSTSAILSRLRLYLIAFFVLVLPNIINDMVFFFNGSTDDDFKGVASTMMALLPLMNSLIYLLNMFCCRKKKSMQSCDYNFNQDVKGGETMSSAPIIHKLKGLEIGDKIGQGIAVVYKGKWRGIEVAVKMQHVLELNNDNHSFVESCNEEIQEEAKLMKSLTHPNIVLFMEAGIYNGSICIVSEYCSRGSLRDILESKQIHLINWPMKLRLAIGISHGIQYLHSSNPALIHRDLKSPNILVDETWHAKIGDFGTLCFSEIVYSRQDKNKESSSKRNSMKVMTGLVGTTRWMAPEVILEEKIYDEKVDIYGFGMILYELIEGKLPFHSVKWNTKVEELIIQGKRPQIAFKSCPPRWKVLISMCWETDPSSRPSVRQIQQILQRLSREEIWENAASSEHMSENGKYMKIHTSLDNFDCDYIINNTKFKTDSRGRLSTSSTGSSKHTFGPGREHINGAGTANHRGSVFQSLFKSFIRNSIGGEIKDDGRESTTLSSGNGSVPSTDYLNFSASSAQSTFIDIGDGNVVLDSRNDVGFTVTVNGPMGSIFAQILDKEPSEPIDIRTNSTVGSETDVESEQMETTDQDQYTQSSGVSGNGFFPLQTPQLSTRRDGTKDYPNSFFTL